MLTANSDIRIVGVRVTEDALILELYDRRTISLPLACYPRLT